ncbi:DUF3560 domain-containing protein (plasmid) [Deinococcus sp. KNUC1210]|uniref:DUF3560 domain-containing protein n=1 Tax=Deinococcus sp. KNUC1210 TaxID=2917691 RepID=UPI001EEF7B17|nr:DUF3560 domain-containing protein [Deinococcus sp. KNUC1210]ULH17919.1 DUF3560 domain-containing protein [Deinococcus sp. KNUC1210]
MFVVTWTSNREDFLLEFVEKVEFEHDPDDRGEARAARFTGRAEAARKRADQRWTAVLEAVAGIPAGQLVLRGRHSQRRHERALERSDSHGRAALEEDKKATYWAERAAGSERRARQKSDPGVISRRIEPLAAELRSQERSLDQAMNAPDHLRYSGQLGRELTPEQRTA